jgi:hypothetical protein
VASLACGFAWFEATRFIHVGFYGTIFTGVVALALGFIVMGFLWLTLDIARPVPEGVDEGERNRQLFALWLGIPLGVLLICAVVGVAAIAIGAAVYGGHLGRN